jgi:hypothetical protein
MEVIGLWEETGYFYLGHLWNVYNNGTADLKFKNGHRQLNLTFKYIIVNRRSKLKVGDYVMANIMNEHDQDCWIPGIIKSIDYNDADEEFVYTVIYFNGEEGQNVNKQLIKIGKFQYHLFTQYLMHKLHP